MYVNPVSGSKHYHGYEPNASATSRAISGERRGKFLSTHGWVAARASPAHTIGLHNVLEIKKRITAVIMTLRLGMRIRR
jgi:hypothetical protein